MILTSFPRIFAFLLLTGFPWADVCPAGASGGPDPEAFRNPPVSARPGAFWNWLNGNVERERLTYDLEQMKEKGMSGAEIWDVAAMRHPESIPGGPEFLGPESAASIRFALSEGKRLGLRMGMITSSGWNAGGTWVKPDWASKTLVSSSVETTGPAAFEQALPFPAFPKECPVGADGKPAFSLEIATLAFPSGPGDTVPDAAGVVDLSDRVGADGVLRWNVPAGSWRILRFVCTNTGQSLIVPSPKSNGLFIDFLDPAATRRHLQIIMDRLGITPANAAESGLDYLEVDSMELHEGHPWTDAFRQRFTESRGYDPLPYLPVLAGWTVKDRDASDRFLYDYRKAVSDLLIHSHYETGSAFLDEYGMEFVGEAGGPGPPVWNTCPVDAIKALGNVHVPRGEFWIQHRNMFLIKEVASAAHVYGKPVVDAEAFTTWRRWEDSPFVLKTAADRAFAEGLNRLTIHGFAHSPESAGLPGRTYHAGVDINPNTTWWPYARPFMDYLARCSYLLQQGLPAADVLWYYGDKAPNFFPEHHDVPEKPRLPGLSPGYDYDVVDSAVILNRLKVENGRFVLPEGASYAVLAFPDDVTMPLEVLEKIESLVRQGGTAAGAPPESVPGLLDHEERSRRLRETAARLWGGDDATSPPAPRRHGDGKAYRGHLLDDVLKSEGVAPDFSATVLSGRSPDGTKNAVDYIHRTAGDSEIYFVRNPAPERTLIRAAFRVSGKTPELWDPSTGVVSPVRSFAADAGAGVVTAELELDPGGATFVVFSGKPKPAPAAAAPAAGAEADGGAQEQRAPLVRNLEPAAWTLSFPANQGAPTSNTLATLRSWTEFENPGIRYFSGIGEYTTRFVADRESASTSAPVFLDLGVVNDVAQVELNGTTAGVVWKPPYRVDVSGLLKTGPNDLTVRVANQWHNRRVGDALAPKGKRITKSNQPLPKKGEGEPLRSGLEGPVRLILGPP